MTFWQFWTDNRQKIYGSTTAFFSVLGGLLAAGAFSMLLSDKAIAGLGILVAIVTGMAGAGTVKSGFANTSRERIAASNAEVAVAKADIEVAKADQATAMKTAIEAVPAEMIPQLTGVKP